MEHRAPRLPESMFAKDFLDDWPFHKFDFIRLTLLMEKLIEKESEERFECRLELVVSVIRELAAVINAIVARHRELVKLIRRCKKKGTPEGDALALDYERQRQVVLCDAAMLSAGISRNRFGSLFPKTRRRLARRIKWLVTSNKRSDEIPNAADPETLFRPPASFENSVSKKEGYIAQSNDYISCSTRLGVIIDFSGGILKTLSDKYLRNYNPD
ncbi:MAG: hypothetical protein FWC43_12235 [Planctomycetaceae bacterium]|nr:hypothetical protein [Planctomycetaceae bacterium]